MESTVVLTDPDDSLLLDFVLHPISISSARIIRTILFLIYLILHIENELFRLMTHAERADYFHCHSCLQERKKMSHISMTMKA